MIGADPPIPPGEDAPPVLPAGATPELFHHVYQELRELARRRMRQERPGHTLRPTDLVHEVFMRMSLDGSIVIQSRAHFLGLAGRVMRQILVDHARRRAAEKHGGGLLRVPLEDADAVASDRTVAILELEDAIQKLAAEDKVAGDIVVYRFYGGLTDAEIGELMARSDRWVRMQWTWARAWLRRALDPDR
jgi:RNA polymerase sigma factor (TIGR02999 family)